MNQCQQSCIDGMIALFQGDTRCAAIAVAIAAFVLGAVVAGVLLKLCCCSGSKKKAAPARRTLQKRLDERPFEKRKPHPAPADGSVEIYVGNLSYDLSEDQLRKEFEAFGTVNSARLIMNKFTGKSKGFGFVHMPNREEAEKACAALNGKEILGRNMKCNEAKNLV